MMPALRCSICTINWPRSPHYKKCPECLEPTSFFSDADPIDQQEAHTKKLYAEFERFYQEREERLGPLESRS